MKHRLKMFLREAWARLLFHTGLWWVVDKLTPRRLLVLAGHCVEHPACNADLSPDMKITAARLERILGWLGARFELCTVGDGVERLGEGKGRSQVALSMDDGYQDNVDALLPLLQRMGAPATVYLESRPLDERRVNWSHKYFWLLDELGPQDFVLEYVGLSRDEPLNILLQQVIAEGQQITYLLKRRLKYDSDPLERERAMDALFVARGGDERALCNRLYMTWDGARTLRDAGVELGGHTKTHHVLATLVPEQQALEVAEGHAALTRELGDAPVSFAYPFGRAWDFDEHSVAAVHAAGFRSATTTHAGTNRAGADLMRLKRWMIDDQAKLHLLACEACGGFDLLRTLGLDLSE